MNNDRNTTSASQPASSSRSTGAATGQPSNRWQDHPFVRRQYFHVLPLDLLEEIEPLLDRDYCKQALWRIERHLSAVAAKGQDIVCIWDGRIPLSHPFLFPRRDREEVVQGLSQQQVLAAARREQEGGPIPKKRQTFLDYRKIAAAYCGWLLTCRLFLAEHDALLGQLQKAISADEGCIAQAGPLDALASGKIGPSSHLTQAYRALCTRWRLAGLAGPGLPIPEMPTHMVLTVSTPLHRQWSAGRFVHVPDLYGHLPVEQLPPSPSAGGNSNDQHLGPWHVVLSPGNRNKGKQVQHYRNWFRIRHTWNLLRQRHGQALRGNLGTVKDVLSVYCSVKLSTVRSYLATS